MSTARSSPPTVRAGRELIGRVGDHQLVAYRGIDKTVAGDPQPELERVTRRRLA